jgi:hypothetical protein
MRNLAKKIMIYSMVGMMQVGLGATVGATVIEASPFHNDGVPRIVQLDGRHDEQRENEEWRRHEIGRHEQEMRRHHNENDREWHERQERENRHHEHERHEYELHHQGFHW